MIPAEARPLNYRVRSQRWRRGYADRYADEPRRHRAWMWGRGSWMITLQTPAP